MAKTMKPVQVTVAEKDVASLFAGAVITELRWDKAKKRGEWKATLKLEPVNG